MLPFESRSNLYSPPFQLYDNYEFRTNPFALVEIKGQRTPLFLSARGINYGVQTTSYFLEDYDGNEYIAKIPLLNPPIVAELRDKYKRQGFFEYYEQDKGINSYRVRSPEEQAMFLKYLFNRGINVVNPIAWNSRLIILPFIPGITLIDFLKSNPSLNLKKEIIYKLLSNLLYTHQHGVALGDRWPENTIVTPNHDIVEIDIEVALEGPSAREFELAKVISGLNDLKDNDLKDITSSWYLENKQHILDSYNIFHLTRYLKKIAENPK